VKNALEGGDGAGEDQDFGRKWGAFPNNHPANSTARPNVIVNAGLLLPLTVSRPCFRLHVCKDYEAKHRVSQLHLRLYQSVLMHLQMP
jgi:hypothetical protein